MQPAGRSRTPEATAEEKLSTALELLSEHIDDEPCHLDHNCQSHMFFEWDEDAECHHKRTRRFLRENNRNPDQ